MCRVTFTWPEASASAEAELNMQDKTPAVIGTATTARAENLGMAKAAKRWCAI